MSHHDLRGFLGELSRRRQLLEVGAPVDPELESTALCRRVLQSGGPALLMRNPVGSRHALLGNLFGHRDRIELALGGRPLASLRELGELLVGMRPGRRSAADITLFESQGMAIQDLVLAARVVDKARTAGLGRDLPY